jgi:hypothetical protein
VEGCACAVERRLVVCARNKCWTCGPEQDFVPETCEFEILHPLETFQGVHGVQSFPRRSGKTRRLVEYANYLQEGRVRVYFLVMNRNMGERLPGPPWYLDKQVMIVSQHQTQKLDSLAPGYILADEITPDELKKIGGQLQRHKLVAAWYTPR